MKNAPHFSGFRRHAPAAFLLSLLLAGPAPGLVPTLAATPKPADERTPPTGPDAAVVAAFQTRLKTYLDLHRKIEATLPKLPRSATPEQIDKNQRTLGVLIQSARTGAKQGDLFDRDMQRFVRKVLARVFAGPEGKTLKSSIMDENPGLPTLKVNDRYPDAVPLSTMPPEVLTALPQLEEDLEYRFVGERLVLYDSHAHIIVDFMDDVLPV